MNQLNAFLVGGATSFGTFEGIQATVGPASTFQDCIVQIGVAVIGGLVSTIVMPFLRKKFPQIYGKKNKYSK